MIYLSNWIERLFIGYGELFLRLLSSKQMWERGRRSAEAIARLLKSLGVESGKVLEVGCGNGRVTLHLARYGYEVYGIDISPILIEDGIKRARELGLDTKVKFIVGDARELVKYLRDYAPFKVVYFIWTTVIGYYDEETDRSILKQCLELTEEGGYLLILEHANSHFISLIRSIVPVEGVISYYDDLVVIEYPDYRPEKGLFINTWRFYKQQNHDLKYLGEVSFQLRAYSLNELIKLAEDIGWKLYKVLGPTLELESVFRPALHPINVVFKKC